MKDTLCLFIIYCLSACSYMPDKDLRQALRVSGENRAELEAVLKHYKNDSLKLKAACFLIKHMPYHFSLDEYYLSPDEEKYRPDIAILKEKEEVSKHCDSLTRHGYRIERRNIRDITSLDSAFLVNNIDLAFAVWRKPWAKNISFDDFCRYILPYRAQIEKVSNLRKEMMERFIPILDSGKATTPLDACVLLNEHLKKVIRYQDPGLPFYPTIEETYRTGISQCEGICDLGVAIMRSVGIPVAVDFTVWAKMDLEHSWCAVLDNGRFHSFGPGEDQPGEHVRLFSNLYHRRPAKVYRSRFGPLDHERNSNDDGYNTLLKSPLSYDVTNEYLDKTISVKIIAENKADIRNKQSDQVYVCVYNFYQWKPIDIGTRKDNGMCVFDNVVRDNIFIVADCPDRKNLRYITAPFYVSTTGATHQFTPKTNQTQTHVFEKQKDVNHTLFYWDVNDKCFTSILYQEETNNTKTYNQIPQNALLRYTKPGRVINQRVFFIENGKIRIY